MDSLAEFARRADVENERLLRKFEDVLVENIVLSKKTNTCSIHVSSEKYILNERVEELEKELCATLCPPLDKVVILPRILGVEKKKLKKVIDNFWNNIFYLIKKECPSVLAYNKGIEHMCLENKLYIKLPNEFIYDRFNNRNLPEKIKTMIKDQLDLDLELVIEIAKENENDIDEIDHILRKQEKETMKIIENMEFDNTSEENLDEEKYVVEYEKDPNIFYGRDVNAFHVDIKHLKSTHHTISVTGEVFDTDLREFRNGKSVYKIFLTDNTGAVLCKVYLDDMNKDTVIAKTKVGAYIKIKGDVYKNRDTELEINITGIKKEKKPLKMDKSEEKRVELHAHTQMSAMDSVVPVKELVATAASWGHKAIAITDHAVVQAFPDAMNAGSKNKIKILYGVEANLVDDAQDIILNANDKDFDQTFVVFDIETTGFSPKNDNITEIGAVKVKGGAIIDNFYTFVNPKMDIPYEIQELTRITNKDVENAPSIEEALKDFMEFSKDSVFVAHNADFDTGFIAQKCKDVGMEYNHDKVDTLMLARVLITDMKRFSLDKVAKKLGINLAGHHRAVHDAAATADIFLKFIDMFKKAGAEKLSDVNRIYGKVDYTKLRPSHATIYAINQTGLKNLYKIISASHVENYHASPRVLKSVLAKHREGLILGSACSNGELFNAILRNKGEKEIEKLMDYYDFLEIMPISNNRSMIERGEVRSEEELRDINRRIVELGERYEKIVAATGDVHTLEEYQGIYRAILKYSQGFGKKGKPVIEDLHFRTTDEMLEEFSYLGEEKAFEVVVTNTNLIADMFEEVLPIPKETFPPVIDGSDKDLRDMCEKKAKEIYGDPLPEIVSARLERELKSIIGNGYAVMYIIANKLVAKSMSDGYLVGSRGSVGSSFAATMSDITEVNPLPAHYICPNKECKHSEFFAIGEYGSGIDLENKKCPKCGTWMIKEGNDIPFEVFLGFEGDKEPDIDLNFSGTYQPVIHAYTEEFFGKGYTYRAGTIGTVKEKTAFGYVKKYADEQDLDITQAEANWLTLGCSGVKKTSGQHPGGVMVIPNYKDVHDFTPIQYPANDVNSGVQTTHFDYHSISGRILKLDILGHDGPTIIRMLEDMTGITITDIPLDDQETMSLFTSTKALGVTEEEINSPVGSLAIPEFGTKFTRQMLIDTQPTTFAELVRISGLSHGTDVWVNNAQDLVRSNVVGLKDVISTRDDIMNYLIFKGLVPKTAFTIMESVRKGRGLTPDQEAEMVKHEVPEWYISSCKKIKYMFPKAHAVAYVMTSFRIAYCKVNYPEAFYATYFTTKIEDFDIEWVENGVESVKKKMMEISEKGQEATTKENAQFTIMEVIVEMYARGIEFMKIDIYKSHPDEFSIAGPKQILPPMLALQGMGASAAKNIAEERKNGEFISKEDLIKRTKVSKTVIEKLTNHGSLENMSEKNQLSFF